MRMKLCAGVVIIACCLVRPAVSQVGQLGLFADAALSDCSINDTAVGLVEIHIAHVGGSGATASEFVARVPPCWNAVWIGDQFEYPEIIHLGSTQGDYLMVAYGSCKVGAIYLGRMTFFASGTGQACCLYTITHSTQWSTPVMVDCTLPSGRLFPLGVRGVRINENASCPCQLPVANEETTWGKVKSLYR